MNDQDKNDKISALLYKVPIYSTYKNKLNRIKLKNTYSSRWIPFNCTWKNGYPIKLCRNSGIIFCCKYCCT